MNKARLRRIGKVFAHGLGMRFFHPRRIDLGVEQAQLQEQIAPPPLAYIEPEIHNNRVRAFLASFLSEETCDLWCFEKKSEGREYPVIANEIKADVRSFIVEHHLTDRTAPTKWLDR